MDMVKRKWLQTKGIYYSIILVVLVHHTFGDNEKILLQKNNLTECKVNITFHELLLKNGEELENGLMNLELISWTLGTMKVFLRAVKTKKI